MLVYILYNAASRRLSYIGSFVVLDKQVLCQHNTFFPSFLLHIWDEIKLFFVQLLLENLRRDGRPIENQNLVHPSSLPKALSIRSLPHL